MLGSGHQDTSVEFRSVLVATGRHGHPPADLSAVHAVARTNLEAFLAAPCAIGFVASDQPLGPPPLLIRFEGFRSESLNFCHKAS